MKDIDCEKCIHCTKWYCEVYGDAPEYVMPYCKKENFIHYREKD